MKLLNIFECTSKNSYGTPDTFLIINIDYDKINLVSLKTGCIVFQEDYKTISELERYITFHYEIEKIGTLIIE